MSSHTQKPATTTVSAEDPRPYNQDTNNIEIRFQAVFQLLKFVIQRLNLTGTKSDLIPLGGGYYQQVVPFTLGPAGGSGVNVPVTWPTPFPNATVSAQVVLLENPGAYTDLTTYVDTLTAKGGTVHAKSTSATTSSTKANLILLGN